MQTLIKILRFLFRLWNFHAVSSYRSNKNCVLHTIDAGGRSIGEIARNVWREERSQKTPEASNLALTATEIDVNGHKNDPYFFSIWLREIFNLFYRLYTSTSNNFYNLENSRKFHKIKNSETQKQINYAKKKKFDQSMNSANSHWKFMMKWPKFLNNRRKQTFLKSVMIQK